MLVRRAQEAERRQVGGGFLFTCWSVDVPQGQVVMGMADIPPGQRIPLTGTSRHDSDELSVIVEGRLTLVSGGTTASVCVGDSCCIPAGEEHWCENGGSTAVRLVWVMVPPGGRVGC